MSQLEPRQQAFRNAMAHLSAAVNVITSNGPAGRCGITATAVCSVTDSPPTLMLCINRNSEMNTVFKANGRLCVNVLSGEHEEVARHFAGMTEVPMERRFALHDWREGLAGLPVLHGALANLQGRRCRPHRAAGSPPGSPPGRSRSRRAGGRDGRSPDRPRRHSRCAAGKPG